MDNKLHQKQKQDLLMQTIAERLATWHRRAKFGTKAPGPEKFFESPEAAAFELQFASWAVRRIVVDIVDDVVGIYKEKLKEAHRTRQPVKPVVIVDLATGPGNILVPLVLKLIELDIHFEIHACDWVKEFLDMVRQRVGVDESRVKLYHMDVIEFLDHRPIVVPDLVLICRYFLHEDDERARRVGDWCSRRMGNIVYKKVMVFEPLTDDGQEEIKNSLTRRWSLVRLEEDVFPELLLAYVLKFPDYYGTEIYSLCAFRPSMLPRDVPRPKRGAKL